MILWGLQACSVLDHRCHLVEERAMLSSWMFVIGAFIVGMNLGVLLMGLLAVGRGDG
jgi:hypothetical protein